MKLNIDKSVLNFLIDFGLTEKEITVYMTLLKTGPNTIMNLARETGIKRSTTHNTVEELIKKGLVSQTNYGERRMVIAEDPEKLSFLMDQKKWDITKLEKNLPDVVKQIQTDIPSKKNEDKVEVKYYEGAHEVAYAYELSMKADNVYSFADLDRYYSVYPDSKGQWINAYKKNPKRQVWDILVDSELSRKISNEAHKNYHTKFLPNEKFLEGFGFADYLIFDNTVIIVQLDKENTVATVIKSKPMALSLMALHRSLWNLLP